MSRGPGSNRPRNLHDIGKVMGLYGIEWVIAKYALCWEIWGFHGYDDSSHSLLDYDTERPCCLRLQGEDGGTASQPIEPRLESSVSKWKQLQQTFHDLFTHSIMKLVSSPGKMDSRALWNNRLCEISISVSSKVPVMVILDHYDNVQQIALSIAKGKM
jgi:hypothetical protein